MRSLLLSSLLLFLFQTALSQQSLKVIKDLAQSEVVISSTSNTSDLIELNGKVIFTASTTGQGEEPWITDGTESGTQLLKDINPKFSSFAESSNPRDYTRVGNEVFFIASDTSAPGGLDDQIWKTDGTENGTVKLFQSTTESGISSLTALGNNLLFVTGTNPFNIELYISDGTQAGSTLLKEINPNGSSNPRQLKAFSGKVYFIAEDNELWETDGTTAGTIRVKTMNSSTDLNHLAVVNNRLYFGGIDYNRNPAKQQVYISDGTNSGTQLVWENNLSAPIMNSIDIPSNFIESPNSDVIFALFEGSTNFSIWNTDGTSNGTSRLRSLDLPPGFSPFNSTYFKKANNLVYFLDDLKLWKTDGTASGTSIVNNNFNVSPFSLNPPFVINNELFFTLSPFQDSSVQQIKGLHKIDGSSNSFSLVKEVLPYANTSLNGDIVFCGDDDDTGTEIWKTDGSPNGTSLIKDIARNPTASSNPTFYRRYQLSDHLPFSFNGLLWTTDGSNQGTLPIYDQAVSALFKYNDMLYFQNQSADTLFKSDGTVSGTTVAASFAPNSGGIANSQGVSLSNGYFYRAPNSPNSAKDVLWKTDGTTNGTLVIKDLYPGAVEVRIDQDFAVFNGQFLFQAEPWGGPFGFFAPYDLWISDGTSAGTKILKAGDANSFNNIELSGQVLNNEYYFTANNGIWKTDGSANGTVLVSGKTNDLSESIVFNNQIFFSNGELWKTDGTNNGTEEVKDISLGSSISNPRHFIVYQNQLFFNAETQNSGRELWVTDGTTNGTQLFKEFIPGSEGGEPRSFVVYNDTLFFSAEDQLHGRELWKSDGSTNGTSLRADLLPGTSPSFPTELDTLNQSLIFKAVSPLFGNEIWRMGPCIADVYTDTIVACEQYTWIDGNTYTSSTNSPSVTYTDRFGCDSTMQLNLTIAQPSSGTFTVSACEQFTWIDGNTYTSSNNTATYVLTDSKGCDSTVTLNLTITGPSYSTEFHTSCNAFTWRDGNTYTESTDTPTITLTDSRGCDSIINLDFTFTGIKITENEFACRQFTWRNGITYTQSTDTPKVVLQNSNGCDSTITLDLTIFPDIETYITTNGEIFVNASGAKYQWLDCNQFFTKLENDTNQSFTPTEDGAYAVEVNVNGCIDTSECVVLNVGLNEYQKESLINVYPNPARDRLFVEYTSIEIQSLQIADLNGRILKEFSSAPSSIDVSELSEGVYYLRFIQNDRVYSKPFVVMK